MLVVVTCAFFPDHTKRKEETFVPPLHTVHFARPASTQESSPAKLALRARRRAHTPPFSSDTLSAPGRCRDLRLRRHFGALQSRVLQPGGEPLVQALSTWQQIPHENRGATLRQADDIALARLAPAAALVVIAAALPHTPVRPIKTCPHAEDACDDVGGAVGAAGALARPPGRGTARAARGAACWRLSNQRWRRLNVWCGA